MVTHFSNFDLCFIFSGFALVAGSLIAFANKKITLALFLLFCGGFVLRLWMAFIDPFINMWDEQFHAMVARNMMQHPFTPMLYEHPALSCQVGDFTKEHFWVHKPPLFLWQIALAMKIFGTKYWVVRIPSVVLTSLCIPVIFRMGKLLSNEITGYFAALLFAVVCLQINVVSGFINTDHNDVIFMCYVLFSCWAWMEFSISHLKKWILLTGIFSGMAILVKWLPGLLVYGAWFVAIVFDKNSRASWKVWREMMVAFFITIIVSAPWFIYITMRFPAETKAAIVSQNHHLNDALGHAGPWWYHFQLLRDDYGWWMVFLLPLAIFLFLKNRENRFLRMGIVASVFFVYVFYSFVQTRMPLFCLLVSPLILLMLGEMLANFLQRIHGKKFRIFFFIVLAFFVYTVFDSGRIESIHTIRGPGNGYRQARIENKKQFENATATLPSPDYVIFNCGGYVNGEACMFYTGFTAYNECPDEQLFQELKSQGIKMAVFDDISIPDYMMGDNSVIKLHFMLMRNNW